MLAEPRKLAVGRISEDALEQNARLLEGTLEDFGVKGEIINVRPGPVVTLYELEPAPGIKSSRVISLSDDVARSMSALSARIAVVQGRNAIGIELPNQKRETVYLRELLNSVDYEKAKHKQRDNSDDWEQDVVVKKVDLMGDRCHAGDQPHLIVKTATDNLCIDGVRHAGNRGHKGHQSNRCFADQCLAARSHR